MEDVEDFDLDEAGHVVAVCAMTAVLMPSLQALIDYAYEHVSPSAAEQAEDKIISAIEMLSEAAHGNHEWQH